MIQLADLFIVEINCVCFFIRHFVVGKVDGRDDPSFDTVFDEYPKLMNGLADRVYPKALYFRLCPGKFIVISEEVNEVFIELKIYGGKGDRLFPVLLECLKMVNH